MDKAMSLSKEAKTFLQTIMGFEKIIGMEWNYNSKTLQTLMQKYLMASLPCAAHNG